MSNLKSKPTFRSIGGILYRHVKYAPRYALFLGCVATPIHETFAFSDNLFSTTPIDVNQQVRLKGHVVDENGVAISGATISVIGTTRQVGSGVDGSFEIDTHHGAVIQVSYVGYITRNITVDRDHLTVRLLVDATGLEEVVVVGYGTQKRGNVTAAISTIQSKDILTTTHSSLAQSLQGKIPGLQIRQQNSEPGAFSSTINIRGFGEPLYVIDGIVRDGGVEFQQLNPNDIESISVLKDASAAIYGLNAANGVILVTTKKGNNSKPTFNYTGTVGFQQPTNVPKMANAAQYLEMYNDAIFYRDGVHSISKEELNKWREGIAGYESTNWYASTFKNTAVQQQHDFSVRGGTENINYFTSVGYFKEGGLFKSGDMGYDRYTFRSNLSAKLSDRLKADVMVSGRRGKREFPGGDGFIWMYKGTIISRPNESPYINGDPNYPANIYNQQNAVVMSQRDYAGYTEDRNKNFQSAITLTYDVPFVEGMKALGTISYDSYNVFNKNVWKNYRIYNPDLSSLVYNNPRIANNADDAERMVFQGQLNYDRTFAEQHNISATAVFELKKYTKKHAYLWREYEFFTTDIVDYASGRQINNGNEFEERNMSYIGRVNYDFKGKYLLGSSFRYDGSYRYAPGKRWGFFPSVSAGWRISEESFIKNNLPFVNNLKIRGSYGSIGENVGDPFQHILGFTPQTNEGAEFINGSYTGGLSAPGVINPDFTWVESTIADIGAEATLFRGKLSFEVDYYQRKKTGKPIVRSGGLPNTFGGSMPVENFESELTRGFDFVISHQNQLRDFKYGLSFNMNLARTKHQIVDKAEANSSYERWRNGYVDRWNDLEWGFNKTGQFQNYEEIYNGIVYGGDRGNTQVLPGDFTYEDVNGDGVIDDKDLMPIFRNRVPKMFYGFVLNGEWKNIDINMVFQGASLYSMRFNEVFSQMFFNNGNLPEYFYDRWHLADPYDSNSEWVAGEWPANRFVEHMGANYRESSAWRMKADYLRLKSIEVGYRIPLKASEKRFVNSIRVYANAHNLLTFADSFIKQFDPERFEGDYQAGYNYPLIKSYNFGVNVTF
ncbi:SusC/RagA family TonB-linked outer membrane protein [Sphingobacterium sp. SYP-B4668]|uniref:SusC/RagA family TonB-linked outer membrane protein n=1 Tax=Sphingobacterium sp. SYP-B4668 TaxID=2996035 RepID=UPI0022DDA88A|nr:TonB-dependent receptor [Sphingobacterium sp. SYP-B4668]